MPVIESSKKALRRDRRRTVTNVKIKKTFKEAVKVASQKPTAVNLKKAYSALDTAAKKNYIHKNKSSRLKSRLAKLLSKTGKK